MVQLCSGDVEYREMWIRQAGNRSKAGKPRKAEIKECKRSPGGKVFRFLKARRRWQDAGKPLRPEALTTLIYETICGLCDEFNSSGSCKICGCRLSRDRKAFLNKIAWATEHCPIGKW
jgi:hypothetical protein